MVGSRLRLIALPLMLVWMSSAYGSAGAREASQGCGESQNQTEMTQCAARELGHAEELLASVYEELADRLADTQYLMLLEDSQQAWSVYRDAQCAFEASASDGGSVQPFVRTLCLIESTMARSAELESQRACHEGELSCVAPVPPQ